MRTSARLALVVSLLAAVGGCAGRVPRSAAPRIRLGYTDHRLFAVMHFDAYESERGASLGLRDYAGRVAGRVCGADVDFEAEYHGSTLRLVGFAKLLGKNANTQQQAEKSSMLDVRDRNKNGAVVRTIDGKIGGDEMAEFSAGVDGASGFMAAALLAAPSHHEVALRLMEQSLSGKVGFRSFDLHAEGDDYVGTMIFAGHRLPFIVHGRAALWSMPAADEATILPLVLTCVYDERRLVQVVDLNYQK
jgi:hypothetical protein